MNIVILGLSITSSWGNGHATTYRSLVRGLSSLGHCVLFLERDMPWYASNRDMPELPYCRIALYPDLHQMQAQFTNIIENADLVILGSFVPQGVELGQWLIEKARGITAFYDIDTPVTLSKLRARDYQYLCPDLIGRFNLYLSFTGGPVLTEIQRIWGSPRARPLYCSVDPEIYFPQPASKVYDLGYIGTYSPDRQRAVDDLILAPARVCPDNKFILVGPQYPDDIAWPANLDRIYHLPPIRHTWFYNAQRFTLNLTRTDMIRTGFSPSVRLFEAAACGTAIISDYWPGIETVLEPRREILIANSSEEVIDYLKNISQQELSGIADRARHRILCAHTATHRAAQLIDYCRDLA